MKHLNDIKDKTLRKIALIKAEFTEFTYTFKSSSKGGIRLIQAIDTLRFKINDMIIRALVVYEEMYPDSKDDIKIILTHLLTTEDKRDRTNLKKDYKINIKRLAPFRESFNSMIDVLESTFSTYKDQVELNDSYEREINYYKMEIRRLKEIDNNDYILPDKAIDDIVKRVSDFWNHMNVQYSFNNIHMIKYTHKIEVYKQLPKELRLIYNDDKDNRFLDYEYNVYDLNANTLYDDVYDELYVKLDHLNDGRYKRSLEDYAKVVDDVINDDVALNNIKEIFDNNITLLLKAFSDVNDTFSYDDLLAQVSEYSRTYLQLLELNL